MISVIVPAYNEEKNLSLLLDDLLKLDLEKEIIVVNDNSADSTPKIADEYAKKYSNVMVVHRKKGDNGMGAALLEGCKKSKGDIITWVMGDRSDDLNTIYRMVEKINEGYDLVVGSRYMKGGSIGDNSKVKALMSGGYSLVAKMLFRWDVHDIGNAFRSFRKEVIDSVELERKDFSISPELAIKSHLKGFRLGEVPTGYNKRKEGTSKFNLLKMGAKDISLFKYLFVKP